MFSSITFLILRSGLSFYIGCIINGIISGLRYLWERDCSPFIISISVGNLGIQLSLGAEIGEGFKFEHFWGIVIGSIKIGKNCNIFHNVTLGYAGRCQGEVLPLVTMW